MFIENCKTKERKHLDLFIRDGIGKKSNYFILNNIWNVISNKLESLQKYNKEVKLKKIILLNKRDYNL